MNLKKVLVFTVFVISVMSSNAQHIMSFQEYMNPYPELAPPINRPSQKTYYGGVEDRHFKRYKCTYSVDRETGIKTVINNKKEYFAIYEGFLVRGVYGKATDSTNGYYKYKGTYNGNRVYGLWVEEINSSLVGHVPAHWNDSPVFTVSSDLKTINIAEHTNIGDLIYVYTLMTDDNLGVMYE